VSRLGFGTVTAFDGDRGLGVVTDGAGREWPFHCTSIADGTRAIDVGTDVAFVAAAGNLGRMWADEVTALPAARTRLGDAVPADPTA
jgi:cold shock CspA family protein